MCGIIGILLADEDAWVSTQSAEYFDRRSTL